MTVIDLSARFNRKKELDDATAVQKDHLEAFKEIQVKYPDCPVWPIVIELQTEFVKDKYREQHLEIGVFVDSDKAAVDGDSMAAIWKSLVGPEEPECIISVQATRREIPRAVEAADPSVYDEFLFMIEDINANDRERAAAMLVRGAMMAFKEKGYLLVCLDGDPDENLYLVQAYTPDRKWLLDLQIDYAVVQAEIDYKAKQSS